MNINFDNIYTDMWDNMKDINGVEMQLVTNPIRAMGHHRRAIFDLVGIFSGNHMYGYYGSKENNSAVRGTIKIKIEDLRGMKFDIGLGPGKSIQAPTSNLMSAIDHIVVRGVTYKIEEEKLNGFGNIIVMKVIRR